MKKRMLLYVVVAVLTLTMSFLGYGVDSASSEKTEKQLKKEEEKRAKEEAKRLKKEKEAIMDSLKYSMAMEAIDDFHFVITADRVRFTRGYTVNVNSSTNFVLVQDDRATVQLALERGMNGFNGLGGITVEGRITNVEKAFDKKGNLLYRMMVSGTAISADVSFTLPKNGTACDVTVSSNFRTSRLTFSGSVHPYNSTTVFKGRQIP